MKKKRQGPLERGRLSRLGERRRKRKVYEHRESPRGWIESESKKGATRVDGV